MPKTVGGPLSPTSPLPKSGARLCLRLPWPGFSAEGDSLKGWAGSMFKFLHAADIHLDSPLRGLDRYEGCPIDEIRGATRKALDNLVRLAIVEQVAFVLIAGDVYDGDWKDHNTGLWFVRRMAELRDAGIKVYLIRGNHDAKNKMTRDLKLPGNVTSLDVNKPQTCQLDHVPVQIHGQGFASQAVTEDLAANYPNGDPGCFNLGMLHTSVTGREGHDRYAPCTVEALKTKNYGYWALGHVHTREVLDDRDGPIVFPGNIQGRHIRESGPKGCLIVSVDGHHVTSTDFRPLDVLRWETFKVDASDLAHPDDVAQRFQDQLPEQIERADDRLLALRVEVVGQSEAHEAIVARADQIAWDIRSATVDRGGGRVWVEKVKIRTKPHWTGPEKVIDGPLFEIDRLIRELRDDDRKLTEFARKELGDLSKKLPLELKASDIINLDASDWLRGVLDEVRPLLVDCFDSQERSS
jgi:exonuclease SbcD